MKLKPIRFSKKGHGKITLRGLKNALEGGTRWSVNPEEEKEARHLAKGIQETLDKEVVEAVLKEYEEERMKKVLEEFSTKIGEEE